jgi:hypothetical protein
MAQNCVTAVDSLHRNYVGYCALTETHLHIASVLFIYLWFGAETD